MARVRDFFGPYRLTRLIRVGHTCEVWEAAKDGDPVRYALKILNRDQRNNREEINVLKHEVEIGKHFKHPNIIRVYEFLIEGDTPFVVMELASALNLKLVLRKGINQVAYLVPEFISQAGEALFHMHGQGYVHCDVKPDNFLVSETAR